MKTEWRGDLLGGVTVIKGAWADGSPLTAIPNYARCNRAPVVAEGRGGGRRTLGSSVWLRDE